MKRILIALALIVSIPTIISAQDSSLPKTVTVLGETLVIKENKGSTRQGFIAEYIPEKETFENWTIMFATRFSPGENLDPRAAAQQTASNITARKNSGDPLANSMIMEAPDKKSIAIDFLASDRDFMEHNVWRYFKTRKGLVSLQIARRHYERDSDSNSSQEFIKSIKTIRPKILDELMRSDLPTVSVAN